MGQYYVIVNLDKHEYLKPHDFGEGAKLMEFGASGCGTMGGLAILLSDGNGRGGGDCQSDSPLIGSWVGDHIVIAGDYADVGSHVPEDEIEMYPTLNLYHIVHEAAGWKNISEEVAEAINEE